MNREFRDRRRRGIGIGAMGRGLTYLLRDEFNTAVSAPLASSRLCEPGPGIMKKDVDTNNNGSISSGTFKVDGTANSNFADPGYYFTDNAGNGFSRVKGRSLIARDVIPNTSINRAFTLGWASAPNQVGNVGQGGLYFASGGGLAALVGTALTVGDAWALSQTYQIASILLSIGSIDLIKGGAYTDWTAIFLEKSLSGATLYPKITGVGTSNIAFSSLRLVDFGSAFDNIATFRDTTLANGDTFTGTADGIQTFELSLNGSPSAGDEVSLDFRRQDANNMHRAILKRNAGNTAWDLQVRTVTSGTPATPSGWTDVTGVGTPVELCVIDFGTTLSFFTRASTTWTKRGNTLTNSSFQTEVGLGIQSAAGTTLTAVTSYPRTSPLYNLLDAA